MINDRFDGGCSTLLSKSNVLSIIVLSKLWGGKMIKVKNVQSIVCLIILFLFANQAWAADWILYSSTSEGNMYYDKSSIKKINNNIIRVWSKKIFNKNGKIVSFSFLKTTGEAPENPDILSFDVALDEFNCVNEEIRTSSWIIYDEKDAVVSSMKLSVRWQDIIPGSVSETLKNIVCSGRQDF